MTRVMRPRAITCPNCGGKAHLVDCGVEEHHRTRTRREQLDDRCTGYVYMCFGSDRCEQGVVDWCGWADA